MTLNVETGSGSSTSDSYASTTDADTYHANRGMTNWATLTTSEKEQALRRGCDYLLQTYRGRWHGYRVSTTQALDWPRYMVPMVDAVYGGYGVASYYPGDSIPREVIYANCEAALRAAAGELIEDLEPPLIEDTVGPITKRYAQGASQVKKFPVIEKLLQPLIAGGVVRMVRA